MILGFTGTRAGTRAEQYTALGQLLAALNVDTFLNGAAWGADREAARSFLALKPEAAIEFFPGDREQLAWAWSFKEKHPDRVITIHRMRKYWERNKLIAECCHRLIATPRQVEEQERGGTWMTIRFAVKAGNPVTIINPDGTSYTRDPTPRNAAPPDTVGDIFQRQYGSLPLHSHFEHKK